MFRFLFLIPVLFSATDQLQVNLIEKKHTSLGSWVGRLEVTAVSAPLMERLHILSSSDWIYVPAMEKKCQSALTVHNKTNL